MDPTYCDGTTKMCNCLHEGPCAYGVSECVSRKLSQTLAAAPDEQTRQTRKKKKITLNPKS